MEKKELLKNMEENRMELPGICQQCPYRRTWRQLFGLWDMNLMKTMGIQQRMNKTEEKQKNPKELKENKIQKILKNPDIPNEGKQVLKEYLEKQGNVSSL